MTKKSKAHYDVLGVPADADEATIRKAYRRAAKKAHPDGGGTSEDFEKISRALRVLTDQRSDAEEARALVRRALLILDDHEFDFEKWEPSARGFAFANVELSWNPPPGFLGKAE